ncbi:MAG: hypothetical protein H6741_34410 [Alphaproteobacteria bacterium]|nr:hypothetical protein [Alphaproteobacteria bacterium]MCB9797801.1 hypothetical protein [Alphaproteobacteria bacterium]
MILLLTESRDPVADEVLAWLRRWGVAHLRLDAEDPVTQARRAPDGALRLCLASGQALDPDAVSATWFRRGALRFALPEGTPAEAEPALLEQWAAVQELVLARLRDKPSLGAVRAVGKLRQLDAARAAGLDTPATLVSSDRDELEAFCAAHPGAITKSLAGAPRVQRAGETWVGGATLPLTPGRLTPRCFPTLAQERLPKAMELRVVSLDGQHFAMGQLPQDPDPLDMRLVDPRCVPWALPRPLAASLSALLEALGLDFGVSDFIVTPQGRYAFLEVNPEGQFERVSKECGFQLERRVAEALRARAEGA